MTPNYKFDFNVIPTTSDEERTYLANLKLVTLLEAHRFTDLGRYNVVYMREDNKLCVKSCDNETDMLEEFENIKRFRPCFKFSSTVTQDKITGALQSVPYSYVLAPVENQSMWPEIHKLQNEYIQERNRYTYK